MSTSPAVWKTPPRRSTTSSQIAMNSAEREYMIGRTPGLHHLGGRAVGPAS